MDHHVHGFLTKLSRTSYYSGKQFNRDALTAVVEASPLGEKSCVSFYISDATLRGAGATDQWIGKHQLRGLIIESARVYSRSMRADDHPSFNYHVMCVYAKDVADNHEAANVVGYQITFYNGNRGAAPDVTEGIVHNMLLEYTNKAEGLSPEEEVTARRILYAALTQYTLACAEGFGFVVEGKPSIVPRSLYFVSSPKAEVHPLVSHFMPAAPAYVHLLTGKYPRQRPQCGDFEEAVTTQSLRDEVEATRQQLQDRMVALVKEVREVAELLKLVGADDKAQIVHNASNTICSAYYPDLNKHR